ncbi:DUF2075 domain-containing protein [Myxococcota bacterium]|nr:DUF2075 domain-containing protein [Myxococcota bacterium]MBU1379827.1 DUF2075 domain-containing protein [Myxococcota bacterium]MBU1496995.1 DUF2075 domain-containing protein [Myxococcota bacterium]
MSRFWYSDTIKIFVSSSMESIIGKLTTNSSFDVTKNQRDAWIFEIDLLQKCLNKFNGQIYLEYSIPRMGSRIDVVLIIENIIFVIEFKVGKEYFEQNDYVQVWDYALDLKNFHEQSHDHFIVPILIPTNAEDVFARVFTDPYEDKTFKPVGCSVKNFPAILTTFIQIIQNEVVLNSTEWENSRYMPTPTIIEAAMALYNNHSVAVISRSEAGAKNLTITSEKISQIIEESKTKNLKSIIFVTGVPGAGKTLVGLNISTKFIDRDSSLYSVFLSGNGPLVKILREALVRDKKKRLQISGKSISKKELGNEVKMFIQNIHNFRDDLLQNEQPPIEHVAIFDEAQRAWDLTQTSTFMKQKKNVPSFSMSEPEFLISCMDRHNSWAVIVCLVGEGQEINTGEAGISEWLIAINKSFTHWKVHVSQEFIASEPEIPNLIKCLVNQNVSVNYFTDLHLAVSLRSFRAEFVSDFVKHLLDCDIEKARQTLQNISNFNIVITRDLEKAKEWLRTKSRGSERYGLIVSSAAERLKPLAIDVKSPVDPVHWFLNDRDDIRSSYYLEDVVTEFSIQGLELDWTGIIWDADLRFENNKWRHFSFRGNKWQNINKPERRKYQINAYRVLLTRARQGMVIVIPTGDEQDPTRNPTYYNPTYEYLKKIGIKEI